MTQIYPLYSESLSHFVVKLENGLNSYPPIKVNISVREAFELFLGIIDIVKCPTISCTIWMHQIDNLWFVMFIFLLQGQGWFVLLYSPTTTFYWRRHITFCRCTFCAFCHDVCGNIMLLVLKVMKMGVVVMLLA
jgi:hypothetical protein